MNIPKYILEQIGDGDGDASVDVLIKEFVVIGRGRGLHRRSHTSVRPG